MITRSECGSGGCITCPFSQNDEAFYAEGTGCLPDTREILEMPVKHKVNWGCHGEVDVVCGGSAKEHKRTGREFNKDLPIVDFNEYTYLGLDVAIALAKVRKGINPLEEELRSYKNFESNIHLFNYNK